jgi:hypothetical protein
MQNGHLWQWAHCLYLIATATDTAAGVMATVQFFFVKMHHLMRSAYQHFCYMHALPVLIKVPWLILALSKAS